MAQAAPGAAFFLFVAALGPVRFEVLAEPGSPRNGVAVLRFAAALRTTFSHKRNVSPGGCAAAFLLRHFGPRDGAAIGAASNMEVQEDEQERKEQRPR